MEEHKSNEEFCHGDNFDFKVRSSLLGKISKIDINWNLSHQIQSSSSKTASSANRYTKKNKVYNLIKAEVEEKAKRTPSKAVSKVLL